MLSLMIDGNSKVLIPANNCKRSIYMWFPDGALLACREIDFAQSNSRIHSTSTYIFPVPAPRTSEVLVKPQPSAFQDTSPDLTSSAASAPTQRVLFAFAGGQPNKAIHQVYYYRVVNQLLLVPSRR